jgi:flagellar motor protein MotB
MRILLTLSVLLLGVSSARAEDKKAAPPNLPLQQLLANEAVQAELKLSDEQKNTAQEIVTEAREALRGLRNLTPEERQKKQAEVRAKVEERIAKALKDSQAKRFRQIDLQQRGPLALAAKKIADEMELTEDQRKELREITQKIAQDVAKLREGGTRGVELVEKVVQLRVEASEKVVKMLTDAQKKTWKKLIGEAFDVSKLSAPR